jgi:transglutaminase-like putative cysteine protease
MYDIRQFKPTLYLVVMLGIIGFTLAVQSPAMFVLAGGAVALNAWLVATGRFTPMPRWMANLLTLLAFLYVAQQVLVLRTTPIVTIGQFLVLLQVAKLYEQRANRDYAQLLVLSLLLMVAASITTASLLFGLLLIVYLFLSLYCCLLFHLKVETDHARAAYALPEDRVSASVLKQDQRYLSRSMRRLTALVSTVAIIGAVTVFLAFPRGTGANMLGTMPMRPSQTLTGFSDQMSFQQIANIQQNTEVVAHVQVWKDEVPVAGTAPLYLRGVTLDRYEATPESGWRWARTPSRRSTLGGGPQNVEGGENVVLNADPPAGPRYRQQVRLVPTGTPTIFALAYPVEFKPSRSLRLRYVERDGILSAGEPLVQKLDYEVISTDAQRPLTPDEIGEMAEINNRQFQSNIDPRIRQYVSQIDVADLLATRDGGGARKQGWQPHALDEEIAARIERHLQTQFAYTLDLTEFGQTHNDDPIVRFLYDFKRGHCEYFAGAMTLLCQSLNMRSRVVIGFKSDDYTDYGHLFTVRQSHAHAWVEVMTPAGWKRFDPTSGRDAGPRQATLLQRMRGMMNFMEFTWATSVIAYDSDNRENLLTNVSTKLDQTAVNSSQSMMGVFEWVQSQFGVFASKIIGPILALLVGGLLFAIGWFVWERWRLRRRAARIGLDLLSPTDQIRLVRQLGFYDDLIRLLERHQMERPPHQTPKEFADSLAYLPSENYDTIRRLTQIFYKVRFGQVQLTPPQRRRLHTVLQRLATSLEPVEGERRG